MNKYRLIIFESNKKDGCMSLAKKFYPKGTTEDEIKLKLSEIKNKIGKKYHFDGKHIIQPCQKDVELNVDYPDGAYTKISQKKLTQKDYWYEKFPCDILLIDTKCPNIVIGHRMADCPVIIAEDIKNQVVAVSHCGAKQINREVPKWTIKALKKEVNSDSKNIKIYIGSCIKRKNYQYNQYPKWATNKKVWKESITKEGNIYYIDLVSSIKSQLIEEGIKEENIKESPIDTYSNKNYYSHTKEIRDNEKDIGQNFVGCFYQEISE